MYGVAELGTILGVWAHPDDEAYLSAGLMALARRAGNRVVVVTATPGEHGTDDSERWPPHRLARLRRRELAASLAALGVTEHVELGYADGSCAGVPAAEAAGRIAELAAEVAPDTIVTFGPEGMTGHPDHRAVSGWADRVWAALDRRPRLLRAAVTPRFHRRWGAVNERLGLWIEPGVPEREVALSLRLDDALLDAKLAALRCQYSQTAALVQRLGEDEYRRWWGEESFVEVTRAASPAAGRVGAGYGDR